MARNPEAHHGGGTPPVTEGARQTPPPLPQSPAFSIEKAMKDTAFMEFAGDPEKNPDASTFSTTDPADVEVQYKRFLDYKSIDVLLKKPRFEDFLKKFPGGTDRSFANAATIKERYKLFEKCKPVAAKYKTLFEKHLAAKKVGKPAADAAGFEAFIEDQAAKAGNLEDIEKAIADFASKPAEIASNEAELDALERSSGNRTAVLEKLTADKARRVTLRTEREEALLATNIPEELRMSTLKEKYEYFRHCFTSIGKVKHEKVIAKRKAKAGEKKATALEERLIALHEDIIKAERFLAEGSLIREEVQARRDEAETAFKESESFLFGENEIAKKIYTRLSLEASNRISAACKSDNAAMLEGGMQELSNLIKLRNEDPFMDFVKDLKGTPDEMSEFSKTLITKAFRKLIETTPLGSGPDRIEKSLKSFLAKSEHLEQSRNFIRETLHAEYKRAEGEKKFGRALLIRAMLERFLALDTSTS